MVKTCVNYLKIRTKYTIFMHIKKKKRNPWRPPFTGGNQNGIKTTSLYKVLRPSGPNYWENVEWIPYDFCKEYCSEC